MTLHTTDLNKYDLNLLPVVLHETGVKAIFARIADIIRANLPGVKEYVRFYEPYMWILNGTADSLLDAFLEKDPNFKYMSLKMDEYERLKDEIVRFRQLIPLNLLALSCIDFNASLLAKVDSLKNRIILGQMEKNKELLLHVLVTFEEMATRAGERIETTAELVALSNFLNTAMSETFFSMKQSISEAMQRLLFLFDYFVFPEEDLELHAKVYYWPEHMDEIFSKNTTRLQLMRDAAEEKLILDKYGTIAFNLIKGFCVWMTI
jgi:hypothetical protein